MKAIDQTQALRLAYGMLRTVEHGGTFTSGIWFESLQQIAGALDGDPDQVPLNSDHARVIDCCFNLQERTELARHFTYLDRLRKSGRANMFGAAPYLMREHCLEKREATIILGQWMATFSYDKTPLERATEALTAKKEEAHT